MTKADVIIVSLLLIEFLGMTVIYLSLGLKYIKDAQFDGVSIGRVASVESCTFAVFF